MIGQTNLFQTFTSLNDNVFVHRLWKMDINFSSEEMLEFLRQYECNVLHLYSAICIASEALLVNHLHSAPSQGRLRQCRLGFEHDTLRLLPLPTYAGTQPIRPTCTPIIVRVFTKKEYVDYLRRVMLLFLRVMLQSYCVVFANQLALTPPLERGALSIALLKLMALYKCIGNS